MVVKINCQYLDCELEAQANGKKMNYHIGKITCSHFSKLYFRVLYCIHNYFFREFITLFLKIVL